MFGRLAAQVARWKLERGASLPSIEQWLGSRTVFSAFLTQARLGGLNTVGVSMTIIWALSPLGAQSILRILGSKDVTTYGPVVYVDTNTPPLFTGSSFLGSGTTRETFDLMRSMITAAMLSADSTKESTQDSWGNVKIPYLTSYADHTSDGSWVKVPDNGVVFSSLIGLPAKSISLGSRLNFNMESSYIELQCHPLSFSYPSNQDYFNFYSSLNNASLIERPSLAKFARVSNGTWQAHMEHEKGTEPWLLASDTFVDPLWLERKSRWIWSQLPEHMADARRHITTHYSPNAFTNETNILTSQARLLLHSLFNISSSNRTGVVSAQRLSTTCMISQPYVESQIECSRIDPSKVGECLVTAQRPSQKPHASTNITHLSFPWAFSSFSRILPTASGLSLNHGLADTSLAYLLNTSSSFLVDRTNTTLPDLKRVSSSQVSHRLGQLINSYLIASQAFDAIAGGISADHAGTLTANAFIHTYEQVNAISIPWLTTFFITALVMFAGSIAGAVFCHVSKSPEILGYASSAIRDSRYVNLAPGFGGLGGLEMTKAFEGIEFRYGVVGKSESGQQLLGVSWQVNAQPIERGVPYV